MAQSHRGGPGRPARKSRHRGELTAGARASAGTGPLGGGEGGEGQADQSETNSRRERTPRQAAGDTQLCFCVAAPADTFQMWTTRR